jgi:hypothetical protein
VINKLTYACFIIISHVLPARLFLPSIRPAAARLLSAKLSRSSPPADPLPKLNASSRSDIISRWEDSQKLPPSFIMQKLYRKALHPRNGAQRTEEKLLFIFHDAFDNLQEIYADFLRVVRGNQLREIVVSHGWDASRATSASEVLVVED